MTPQELLDEVKANKRAISDVKVSELAPNYPQDDPEALADFLEPVLELAHLKSKGLVPKEVESEGDSELAQNVSEYEKFSSAAGYFDELLSSGLRSFAPKSSPGFEITSTFVPPEGLDMTKLLGIFKDVLEALPKEEKLSEEKFVIEKINVEAKEAEVKALILSKRKVNFSELLKTAKSRLELVVTFLAVLEMIKQEVVEVAQSKEFGDMEIRLV